jgi:leucyl-tRNA synthetase
MLKITAYADRLIDDLKDVNFIERVKVQQENWIGRSYGAEVDFATTAGDKVRVFTTRCDTLFGATYMVVSPEHALVTKWLDAGILTNADAVNNYRTEASKKSDFERTELVKDKTGVKLEGIMAINPVNEKQIPIFMDWLGI